MPYTLEHKLRTRERIVEAAARLFRRDGFDRTPVDALMAEAGLTRGGFYAHFRDKIDLLIHALERAFAQSSDNLLGHGLEALAGESWKRAAARRYLSPKHLAHAAVGCAVPGLGAEVARAPRRVRHAFSRGIAELLDGMSERLGGGPSARREATALLASWVGAMVLARASADRDEAEAILAAVRGEASDDLETS